MEHVPNEFGIASEMLYTALYKYCNISQIKKKIAYFILKNIEKKKQKQMKACKSTAEEANLNGHTIGFRSQTQKLENQYMSPLLTLGVKGLKS